MQALKVSFCFFEYILPQITEKVNQLLEIFALYYNLTKKHQMLKNHVNTLRIFLTTLGRLLQSYDWFKIKSLIVYKRGTMHCQDQRKN